MQRKPNKTLTSIYKDHIVLQYSYNGQTDKIRLTFISRENDLDSKTTIFVD